VWHPRAPVRASVPPAIFHIPGVPRHKKRAPVESLPVYDSFGSWTYGTNTPGAANSVLSPAVSASLSAPPS